MTGIENTIEQIRRINERHQQLHAASAKLAAIHVPTVTVPPGLFDSVNSASALANQLAAINTQTVTVPTKLFESVNSAKVLAKQFAAINTQTVAVPTKLFESVNAANVLAKQFVAIRLPTVTVPPKLFESVNLASVLPKQFAAINTQTLKNNKKFSKLLESTEPLRQGTMSGRGIRSMPLNHRGFEFVPKTAMNRSPVRKQTPAEDVVTRIYEEFNRRRVIEEDRRHKVAVVVTLLTGKKLLVESITTNGDHLIRIVGKVNSERRVEIVSGFACLQYEIINVDRLPSRPDLRIVH